MGTERKIDQGVVRGKWVITASSTQTSWDRGVCMNKESYHTHQHGNGYAAARSIRPHSSLFWSPCMGSKKRSYNHLCPKQVCQDTVLVD